MLLFDYGGDLRVATGGNIRHWYDYEIDQPGSFSTITRPFERGCESNEVFPRVKVVHGDHEAEEPTRHA